MDKFESFKSSKPDGKELIRRYPELSDYLTGKEIAIQLNEYDAPNGMVKSLVMDQGKGKQNPTFGIAQGRIEFTPIFTEKAIILEESLEAEIDGVAKKYARGQNFTAPPGKVLKLNIPGEPVYYLCLYNPKTP